MFRVIDCTVAYFTLELCVRRHILIGPQVQYGGRVKLSVETWNLSCNTSLRRWRTCPQRRGLCPTASPRWRAGYSSGPTTWRATSDDGSSCRTDCSLTIGKLKIHCPVLSVVLIGNILCFSIIQQTKTKYLGSYGQNATNEVWTALL